MTKVLLCIPSLATGGAEKFAVDLAVRIHSDNIRVTVAQTRNVVESPFLKTLEAAGIPVVDLSAPSFPGMIRRQLRYLRRERPDVVHANTGSVLHMMLSCWLCRVPKRIYTVHNEAKLLYKNSRLKKAIYRLAFSFFRFTPVAICESVKETLVREMAIPEGRIPVVRNGVDTVRFCPQTERAKPDGVLKLITVGTLYWIKNQTLTVNAVCDLHDAGAAISLTLLGDGEDREELQELIEARGASSYVRLAGRRRDVETALRASDVYVSASKTEGLPLSILEAMACGLPVIATDVGGTKEIVHNGENGYLIPVDDPRGMKDAILKIAADRETFGERSREIAEEWSLQQCVNGYAELYEG